MTTDLNMTGFADSQKVLVTYYDNTTRETTIKELIEFFSHKDEDKNWVKNFFQEMRKNYRAFGKFARYEIVVD